ncbi:nitroreductase [Actinokineospora auranticolor]|uniref:Putative NAD(P)H nitroreductase n=1 Tax=Actinokineospora auranticolor TaxID=155976 RepID=A0A2S6GI55_9PSEU|nr:nitroreductase [Actinokineospora auranticolor]PPK64836.1 nitroreductase [Actinokineospora auranticolor]
MNAPTPTVRDAIRLRRSATRLTGPAPTDADVVSLLAAAANGPDHGLLRPWRFILVRGDRRADLGRAHAGGLPPGAARDREVGKPLRAPLLISIVFAPRVNPKVPEWEQLAATSAVVHNLGLLLHSAGWGSIWRTGPASRCPRVAAALGLRPGERSLGWLYVGTVERVPPPRSGPDLRDRVSTLSAPGAATPLAPAAVLS